MIEWNFENTYYFAAIVTGFLLILSYLFFKKGGKKQ